MSEKEHIQSGEIKNCPFCGSSKIYAFSEPNDSLHTSFHGYIRCQDCLVEKPALRGKRIALFNSPREAKESAISQWNERVTSDGC